MVGAKPSTVGVIITLILAMSVAGCREADQTIVVLDTEAAALGGAAALRVRVCDNEGNQRHDQTEPLGSIEFPTRIPIDPFGGDTNRIFALEATLLTDANAAVQSQRVIATFPGGRHEVQRRFEQACIGTICNADMTCRGGECVTAVDPPLTMDMSLAELLFQCAGEEVCNGEDDDTDGLIDEGDDLAVMPTICPVAMGRTQIVDSWNGTTQNRSRLNRVTLAGCERLSGAFMYLNGRGDEGSYQPHRVLIYANGPDDEPAELLGVSNEVIIEGNPEPAWYHFDGWQQPEGDLNLTPGEYWLGHFSGSPVGDGASSSQYNGLERAGGDGMLGFDNYETGPADPFQPREPPDDRFEREMTLFAVCAP